MVFVLVLTFGLAVMPTTRSVENVNWFVGIRLTWLLIAAAAAEMRF